MTQKLEGTILLDGMVQGKSARAEQLEPTLRAWVRSAKQAGLPFSLEMDGGNFSILADNEPIQVAQLGSDAAATVTRHLEELVRNLIPPERAGLLSTIRSVEYGRNVEIQTLYAVDPSGQVQSRQRNVQAQTVAPAPPPSRRDMVKQGLIGLLVAALVLAVSTFFVDYKKLWAKAMPLDPNGVQVEASAFEPYFAVVQKSKETVNSMTCLMLKIRRTAGFPRGDEDLEKLSSKATSMPSRLALEALARGYIRVDYFDKDGKFITSGTIRVAELRKSDETVLALPLPAEGPLASVTLSY